MRLVENTQDAVSWLPQRGIGRDHGAAHVAAGNESKGRPAGSLVVVVETHRYLGVAVVDGDGGDLDEHLAGPGGGQRRGGEGQVVEAILGRYPLLDGGGERHCE